MPSLRVEIGKPMALVIKAKTDSCVHVGGERVGNVIEHVKSYVYRKTRVDSKPIPTLCELQPIIPATSLKGTLRDLAERIAKILFQGNTVPELLARLHHQPDDAEIDARKHRGLSTFNIVHAQLNELEIASLGEVEKMLGVRFAETISRRFSVAIPRDDLLRNGFMRFLASIAGLPPAKQELLLQGLEANADKLFEFWASMLCPICLLFGSPMRGGALKLTALIPIEESVNLERRYHVAIDRSRRTVSKDKLYVVECIEPETILIGVAYILIPPLPQHISQAFVDYDETVQQASKLLEALMMYVRRYGLHIGGAKGRGYGRISIEITMPSQG